jgi:hypothetical protein
MKRGTATFLTMLTLIAAPAAGQSFEETNGCAGTTEDPCTRTGTCSIQGASWWQEAVLARAGIFDTQGWPGLCDMVHVALVQGDCFPGGRFDVVAVLSEASDAWIPRIDGPLACAGPAGPVCDDGEDNDRDGLTDWPEDAGCESAADLSERARCGDHIDNDGDGWIDAVEDPGCRDEASATEAPACQDGVDNDGDGLVDFDGGASAGLDPADRTDPDPFCTEAWKPRERRRKSCGLVGLEPIGLLAISAILRRRRGV